MSSKNSQINEIVTAIKVHQWLDLWDDYDYNANEHRRKPEPFFYLFTLSAPQLKALSGIYRRTTEEKIEGFVQNIQRRHDEKRSVEINEYYKYGHPYAELSISKKESGRYEDVKRPGWLPTALVVNILRKDDIRKNKKVSENDLIKLSSSKDDRTAKIVLPSNFDGLNWTPTELHPIEVIDGQHRLWAFEGDEKAINFELPVVAFYGLDLSWQAYLFWSINITPKKINPSLAYDLYPLLRSEEWLEKQDNYIIYRTARSQEIVEGLWAHSESPWYQRINMLGEPGQNTVSQSAFIQSLNTTFFRSLSKGIGGLYIAPINKKKNEYVDWSGAQQLAYLIYAWREFAIAVNKYDGEWTLSLRSTNKKYKYIQDPAFIGKYSLLRTDQGVRGYLYVLNGISYALCYALGLNSLFSDADSSKATDYIAVDAALKEIDSNEVVNQFIKDISIVLARFDWRTSGDPTLSFQQRSVKAGFRGSGGYKMLRIHLLSFIKANSQKYSEVASKLLD